jgi:pyruvate dehydrogenase E2 component (dihydrolipoamide acetyltransferase)
MASDVTMPRLSDSMEEGTVLKWLVEEGGEVTRGEALVEIETDKANMTYDADTDGVLVEIVAQEGDTLAIGEVIARIGDASEAQSEGGGEESSGENEDEAGGDEDAEAGDGDAGEAESDGEEAGGGESGESGGEEAEATEEEPEREAATAEGDADEAQGEDEGASDDDAEAASGGDEQESGDGEAAAAQGEDAAVAGAEGGGGETQAGAGTVTREKTSNGNGADRVKASPVARRMARDLGVELAQLEGTGPGGRIVKADVQAAAENGGGGKAEAPAKGEAETAEQPADGEAAADGDDGAKAEDGAAAKAKDGAKAAKAKADDGAKGEAPARDEEKKAGDEKPAKKESQRGEAGAKGEVDVEELTRLQQTISRRMAESKATAPDFSISLTVDMTAAVELRERLKEISDPVPSFNDMVVKASASALREHPRVNGAYRDGKFELYDRVNVGVAVAAMDALVVPTVFDADKKSLGQIARDARAVIGKVKDKTVTPPELSGGTFTVSNLGMFGIEQFTAIINPPQAAILTVGKLAKTPAVDDKGKVVPREQMVLTLVCDHRILYGADGAEFLARVKDLLEQPLSLAL